MIGLLFFAGWGGLLLLTFVLVIVFMSRPWHIGERVACSAMTLLIGLGIPFWDYIPAKMYFNEVCKSAGAEILSSKPYSSIKGFPYKDKTIHLKWNIVKYETTYYDPDDSSAVARLTYYRQWSGNDAFVKPWMSDGCPGPYNNAFEGPSNAASRDLDNKLKAK